MLNEGILSVGNVGKVEVLEQKTVFAKKIMKMILVAVYKMNVDEEK